MENNIYQSIIISIRILYEREGLFAMHEYFLLIRTCDILEATFIKTELLCDNHLKSVTSIIM